MPMHYQQRGDYGAPDENYDGHSGQSKLNQYNYTSTSSNIQEAPLHSRGMTPEQYEAQRRVATPQRNRHRASSRVPPPGKFASQEQPAQETQPFTQMQPSPAPRRHDYSMSQQQPPSPPSRGQHNQRHYSQQPSSQYAHNYQQNVVYPQNTPQYANQRSSHHHALGPSKEGIKLELRPRNITSNYNSKYISMKKKGNRLKRERISTTYNSCKNARKRYRISIRK